MPAHRGSRGLGRMVAFAITVRLNARHNQQSGAGDSTSAVVGRTGG